MCESHFNSAVFYSPPPNSFSLNLRVRWSSGNLLAAVGAEHERRGLRTSVTNFSLKSRFLGVSREAEIVPRKERTDQKFIVFSLGCKNYYKGTWLLSKPTRMPFFFLFFFFFNCCQLVFTSVCLSLLQPLYSSVEIETFFDE